MLATNPIVALALQTHWLWVERGQGEEARGRRGKLRCLRGVRAWEGVVVEEGVAVVRRHYFLL